MLRCDDGCRQLKWRAKGSSMRQLRRAWGDSGACDVAEIEEVRAGVISETTLARAQKRGHLGYHDPQKGNQSDPESDTEAGRTRPRTKVFSIVMKKKTLDLEVRDKADLKVERGRRVWR